MRITSKFLPLLLLAVFLLGLGAVCVATKPKIIKRFAVSLEPVGSLDKMAPVTMLLEYKVNAKYHHMTADTGSYSVILLNARDSKDTLSSMTYPVNYDDSYSISNTFEINLSGIDTSYCQLIIRCGKLTEVEGWHFITSGESIQFLQYYRMPPSLEYQKQQAKISHEVDRDTLSHEDLQREYTVVFDLHDPKDKEFVEKIMGHLSDSSIFDKKLGYYLIKTTAENVFKFIDQGIDGEEIRPQSRDPRLKRDQDSLPEDQTESDTSDQKGSLPNKYLPTAVDGYSLDSVDVMTTPGHLPQQAVSHPAESYGTVNTQAVKPAASGIYFYRIPTGDNSKPKRMILLK